MENGKQLNFENSDEYIDVVIKLDNNYLLQITENDLKFVKLTWKDGTEFFWPELSIMGVHTFEHFKIMVHQRFPNEVIKIQIKKSDIGKNDEKQN